MTGRYGFCERCGYKRTLGAFGICELCERVNAEERAALAEQPNAESPLPKFGIGQRVIDGEDEWYIINERHLITDEGPAYWVYAFCSDSGGRYQALAEEELRPWPVVAESPLLEALRAHAAESERRAVKAEKTAREAEFAAASWAGKAVYQMNRAVEAEAALAEERAALLALVTAALEMLAASDYASEGVALDALRDALAALLGGEGEGEDE